MALRLLEQMPSDDYIQLITYRNITKGAWIASYDTYARETFKSESFRAGSFCDTQNVIIICSIFKTIDRWCNLGL